MPLRALTSTHIARSRIFSRRAQRLAAVILLVFMGELSSAEIESFHRDGYVGPFTLFEPALASVILRRLREEVLPVRCEAYAHTTADPEVQAHCHYRRDRHLDSPLFFRIATASEILSRVASLLGPDIVLWRSDGFEQGVGDPPTRQHQDAAFESIRADHPMIECGEGQPAVARQTIPFEVDIPLSIGVWIAFTTVRKDTGALWAVPGTHDSHKPLVPGKGIAGWPFALAHEWDPSEGHAFEIEAGQFILFHNLLVHGSYPVQHGRRFAWTPRYISPAARVYARSSLNAQGQDLSRWGGVLVAGIDRQHNNVMRAPPRLSTGPVVEERALAAAGI